MVRSEAFKAERLPFPLKALFTVNSWDPFRTTLSSFFVIYISLFFFFWSLLSIHQNNWAFSSAFYRQVDMNPKVIFFSLLPDFMTTEGGSSCVITCMGVALWFCLLCRRVNACVLHLLLHSYLNPISCGCRCKFQEQEKEKFFSVTSLRFS